jgi:uncharacterized membrane-anchored protein
MSNYMIFGILLLPSPESLLPILPAIAIMLTIALAIGLYGFGIKSSPIKAVEKLGMGSKLLLLVGAQVLLLLGFAAKYELVLAQGQTITLRTLYRDPVDFFRGNYLSFSYDITQLRFKDVAFRNSKPLYEGEVVYVTLTPSDSGWQAVSLNDQLPQLSQGQAVLKGTVRALGADNVSVHYGLEQFFLAHSEKLFTTTRAMATVKVNANGDAVLTDLVPLPDEKEQRRGVRPWGAH